MFIYLLADAIPTAHRINNLIYSYVGGMSI